MTRRDGVERFAVSPDVAHREIGGMLLLLLPGNSRLYAFNATGRMIWKALLRKRQAGDIAAAIARRYGIPRTRAERDVRELLADLLRRGAIRRA